MGSSRQIEERAAAWLMKRDAGDWSDEDQLQLSAWLESATVNRVAFLRLEAGWEEANRLKALGAGFPRGRVPTVSELASDSGIPESYGSTDGNSHKRARVRGDAGQMRLFALAATVSAIAIGIFIYAVGPLAGDRYATPIGGVASVPLKDGSNVTLNTHSEIRVQMNDVERRIDLVQGEAFFDVSKDPARPFVVQAGTKQVIAVGTKFSVRRDRDDVRVVVTEGIVRFVGTGSNSGAATSGSLKLTAGSVAQAIDSKMTMQDKAVPDAEDFLSWRSGYVVFHETALADAVAEFNRYNERQIVIQDPAVAAMQLTGKFRSTNYQTFVRLLEDTFQIRARHSSDQIILTTR